MRLLLTHVGGLILKIKRKLNWDDVKRIVEFKTFYLMIVLTLAGVLFLFLEAWFFPATSQSAFKNIFSALGITFITSSTISFLIEIFMRLDIIDFMVARMLLILPKEIKRNVGVEEYYLDRKAVDFDNVWNESEGYLKIIGLSANDILAPARMPLLINKVKENPGFQIQILLLNPWSVMASRRSDANAYSTSNECIKRIYSVLEELRDVHNSLRSSGENVTEIDIRIYDDIPSLSMILDQNSAIVTPLTIASQGGSSPCFIAKNILTEFCVYNLYNEHFDLLWDKAITIVNTNNTELFEQTVRNDKSRLDSFPDNLTEWLEKLYVN